MRAYLLTLPAVLAIDTQAIAASAGSKLQAQKELNALSLSESDYEVVALKVAQKLKSVRAAASKSVRAAASTSSGNCGTSTVITNGCIIDPGCVVSSGCGDCTIDKSAMTYKCVSNLDGAGSTCFAKETTTACLFASAADETCVPALMTDLVPGDVVLGRDGATSVVAVQHKAVDTLAEMLTFRTADGSSVSMTPNHAVFVDGELVAAADVKVGSALSTGAVERITKGEAAIINAVTADGTIVAGGILAASNPMWIASLTIDAPLTRAVVNAVIYAVGDADTLAAGAAKIATMLAAAALAAKALRSRKASA